MIANLLRPLAIKRGLSRSLKARKAARPARSEAAARGRHTYVQRLSENTRRLQERGML